MPNNPYDDLLKNLARLLEQITSLEQNMRKMQDGAEVKPGIIGCAIITGNLTPQDFLPHNHGGKTGLSYEMVDGGERAFITVQLPSGPGEAPEVFFQERACCISMNGLSGTIDLQFQIVPSASSFTFSNGLLDVILVKESERSADPDDGLTQETEFF